MYDPKYWKRGINITAGGLSDYLAKNVPADTVIHICGDNQIFLHMSSDGKDFCMDNEALSELSEYAGCEPADFAASKEGGE